jgi:hypothetical protein
VARGKNRSHLLLYFRIKESDPVKGLPVTHRRKKMSSVSNLYAIKLIEQTLKPMVEYRKRDISKMVMNVTASSPLAEQGYVETKYGVLVVVGNEHLQKGSSYIIEATSKGSTFGWVTRRKEGGN